MKSIWFVIIFLITNLRIISQTYKMGGKAIYSVETITTFGDYKENNTKTVYFNDKDFCTIDSIKGKTNDEIVEESIANFKLQMQKLNIPIDSFQIEKKKKMHKIQLEKSNNPESKNLKQYFNKNSKISTRTAFLDKVKYCIVDTIKKVDWEYTEDTMTIENLLCQKAKGSVGGIMYNVWFAPSLPFSAGIVGFNGLPGLFVMALSENKKFKVRLTSVEYPLVTPIELQTCTDGKQITNAEYKVLYEQYKIDSKKRNEENKKKAQDIINNSKEVRRNESGM